jgi:hypothetical protein
VRADQWSGSGSASSEFVPPSAASAAAVTGSEAAGKTCSAYGQNVLAQVRWRGPDGKSYLLVAGTKHVVKVGVADADGTTRQTVAAPDHTAAVPLAASSPPSTGVGILDTGELLQPMYPPSGQ